MCACPNMMVEDTASDTTFRKPGGKGLPVRSFSFFPVQCSMIFKSSFFLQQPFVLDPKQIHSHICIQKHIQIGLPERPAGRPTRFPLVFRLVPLHTFTSARPHPPPNCRGGLRAIAQLRTTAPQRDGPAVPAPAAQRGVDGQFGRFGRMFGSIPSPKMGVRLVFALRGDV